MAPTRRGGMALVLLLALLTPGCVELRPAHLPDRLLEGPGGNGWAKNLSASQREPDSGSLGFSKSQTLAYEDRQSDQGHPGSLIVTSLRTLVAPSQERVSEEIARRIRDESTRKGITLSDDPLTGERTLKNGARSDWFVYDGNVTNPGFFSRNARVKIVGEVFQCAASKTLVVTVGLAQITDTKRLGGVPLPNEEDRTTWKEIVADPTGTIEGIRGSDGLAYNIAC